MKNNKPVVVLLTTADRPIHTDATKILSEVAEVKYLTQEGRSPPKGETLMQMKEASAILLRSKIVTEEVMDQIKGLKIIARHGAGIDSVDVEAATKRGIIVTNTPSTNATAVAETAFFFILLMLHHMNNILFKMKTVGWKDVRSNIKEQIAHELFGKTLGIVGLGNIGRRVVKRAKAFGMNVIANDSYILSEDAEEIGAILVDLHTLMQTSDVVTIHVPLTDETKHMISMEELQMMKETAFLINTSRGGVVDEKSLFLALNEGWIAGAALDVMETEPPASDNPLLNLENLIITPHLGGESHESFKRTATIASQNIMKVLMGKKPSFVVNPEVFKKLSTYI